MMERGSPLGGEEGVLLMAYERYSTMLEVPIRGGISMGTG